MSRWVKQHNTSRMLVCCASRIACLTRQSGVVLTSSNWHLFIACCLTLFLHYTVGSRGGRAKRHRHSLLALTSREALWGLWSSAKPSCQGSLQYSPRSSLTTLDTTPTRRSSNAEICCYMFRVCCLYVPKRHRNKRKLICKLLL